jgi:ATP adenylyltransferase
MERLHSPWRSKYIESFSQSKEDTEECVFCKALKEQQDEKNLILIRGNFCFVIMNLYPYNSGHLMIVPYRHVPSIIDLSDEETTESMMLIKQMIKAIKIVSHPDGFNIGSNIGRTAGAGIDKHVHFHIVPRWSGDTNFLPILADTKMISEDMRETYRKLKQSL